MLGTYFEPRLIGGTWDGHPFACLYYQQCSDGRTNEWNFAVAYGAFVVFMPETARVGVLRIAVADRNRHILWFVVPLVET